VSLSLAEGITQIATVTNQATVSGVKQAVATETITTSVLANAGSSGAAGSDGVYSGAAAGRKDEGRAALMAVLAGVVGAVVVGL